ncbi:hypothetical protein Zmor_025058 [Zophobas morio]|uniref:Uncharacterized protein n=2 Tax=Zophobas morio TaxID=2755281 RepID=A0AA38HRG9_9CUCU|nr:hypothetical protein Zmor_025058 [Zophobas morio]
MTISETLRVQGSGEGADAQSSNLKPKRKKRSKTAKNNKVAPVVEPRGCRSANDHLNSDDSESPDPLEPWSTKKIANMNKILAWENDQDSM